MLKTADLVDSPSYTEIRYSLFKRYLKVGRFLHIMTLIALMIFVVSIQNVRFSITSFDATNFLWLFLLLFGLSVAVISQLDAFGRFQNYKQLKDKFYEYGFNLKLLRPFMFSKCQRDAILIASEDFESKDKAKKYFNEKGYRWYHILPDVCVANPFVIFKMTFWNKILFTKYYEFQNYHW